MKYTLYPLLCSVILLSSCKKEELTRTLDSFTITGKVTNCTTGQPVSGARIHLLEGSSGLFGYSEEAGETYSDNQGNYSITPYKPVSGDPDWVAIFVEKVSFFTALSSIDAISLRQGHVTTTQQDFGLAPPAYIKVTLHSIAPFDDNDMLNMHASLSGCSNGNNGTATYLSSDPPAYEAGYNLQELHGNIANGYITYELPGNDTAIITYQSRKNNVYDSVKTINAYCPASDTTIIHLNY